VKLRMKINISGCSDGHYDLKRGDIVDFDDAATARKYIEQGYAESKLSGPVGPAYKAS
jgi:hypothetical protein